MTPRLFRAAALALVTGGLSLAQAQETPVIPGFACPACGTRAYIRKDGCLFCTACGHQGECG